jgi:hypothetical protein
VLLFICTGAIVDAAIDSSIPKPLDEDIPIHRAVKANDLVKQIYE